MELFRREFIVARDRELSEPVLLTFVDRNLESGFPGSGIDDQGVSHHREVQIAPIGIETRKARYEIFVVFFSIVQTRFPPPKPFGLHRHGSTQFGVRENAVATKRDVGHRDLRTFFDVQVKDDFLPTIRHTFDAFHNVRKGDSFLRQRGSNQRHDVSHRCRRIRKSGVDSCRIGDVIGIDAGQASDDDVLEQILLVDFPDQGHCPATNIALYSNANVVELPGRPHRLEAPLDVQDRIGGTSVQAPHRHDREVGLTDISFHVNRIDDDGVKARGRLLGAHLRCRKEGSQQQDNTSRSATWGIRADRLKHDSGIDAHVFDCDATAMVRLSPSSLTSTTISSPEENSAVRIFSESGSSTYRWIARRRGRAPNFSS